MNENEKPFGRPRQYDREDIARKLIEWAKKEDSLNLCAFCGEHLIPPQKLGQWAKECDDFRASYDIVKSIIASKREQKLSEGELHIKAYDLNAATYDYFLKEERREEKAHEAFLKSESLKEVTPQKVVFEVNYKNDGNNSVEISPKTLPDNSSNEA